MKRVSLILLPCLLAVILAGLFLHPTFAHGVAASPTSCGKGWSVVSSPNKDGHNTNPNGLDGVAAISTNDVWTVGSYAGPGIRGGTDHALIEHWNGTAWSLIPYTGPTIAGFSDVAAIATNDVWAVGGAKENGNFSTLIQHWNGIKWSTVPSPNPKNGYEPQLNELAVISANDIWAVGEYLAPSASQHILIEHWNGTAWSIVSAPSPKGSEDFGGITAVSSTDVWATGTIYSNTTAGTNYQPFFEHWDGTNWTMIPGSSSVNGHLYALAAVSATDIWSVGLINENIYDTNTLIERWDGTQWTVVPSPNVNGGLYAVRAVSGNNVWAVGKSVDNKGNSLTLIVHWNGTKWSIVSSPHEPNSVLGGLAVVPGTSQVWAVGEYENNNGYERTLTEYYC